MSWNSNLSKQTHLLRTEINRTPHKNSNQRKQLIQKYIVKEENIIKEFECIIVNTKII